MTAALRRPQPLGDAHRLEGFACGDEALDRWLTTIARQAQGAESARTYVVTQQGDMQVIGYFALAASGIQRATSAARVARGQPDSHLIPALLIARLAVDQRFQGQGVGRSLLLDAVLRCSAAADAIGARVILVHAKDDAAAAWYRQFGFVFSPSDPYNLQLLMKDARATLRQVEG